MVPPWCQPAAKAFNSSACASRASATATTRAFAARLAVAAAVSADVFQARPRRETGVSRTADLARAPARLTDAHRAGCTVVAPVCRAASLSDAAAVHTDVLVARALCTDIPAAWLCECAAGTTHPGDVTLAFGASGVGAAGEAYGPARHAHARRARATRFASRAAHPGWADASAFLADFAFDAVARSRVLGGVERAI